MKDKKTKIVFFGTPEFALPTLAALLKEGYDIVLVVSQPDKPVGRKQILTPAPIKVAAQKMGLKVYDNLEKIRDTRPELGIVVAYGSIIPQEILNLFPHGCLNIHPSLLPKYRGPSPIQSAILNGDKKTGLTIIKLDKEMDHGPIISQQELIIDGSDNAESLNEKSAKLGAKLLIKILPDYLSGKIKAQPQNHDQATLTKIITHKDGEINWHLSAKQIKQQIKAYNPWPGSYTQFKDKTVKLISAEVSQNKFSSPPGSFIKQDNQLYIPCQNGSLKVSKLQIAGKKEITAEEFINGYL